MHSCELLNRGTALLERELRFLKAQAHMYKEEMTRQMVGNVGHKSE